MIRAEWGVGLLQTHAAALQAMLAEAAAEDEEPGFPRIRLDGASPGASHLVVWMVPDGRGLPTASDEEVLAAYLRLTPGSDGAADVEYVVRPSLRSLGITTLLLESIGLDVQAPGGWAGTGATALRTWARGDHPAAIRLSQRFGGAGIRRAQREWQLLLPLRDVHLDQSSLRALPVRAAAETDRDALRDLAATGSEPDSSSRTGDVLVTGNGELNGAVWFDVHASETTDYGPAARVHRVLVRPGPQEDAVRWALLAAVAERMAAAGVRAAAITIDSQERQMLSTCRSVGFLHDRTDALYILP